jgi:hypothetical protein
MLFVLPKLVTELATLAVIALAFVRGRSAERLVAGMTLASMAWSLAHGSVYGADLAGELARDAAFAAVVTAIALKSDRYWALAAASVWWVSVVTELVQMIAPVDPWAYGTAELLWWYLSLACLGVGAWRARTPQPSRAAAAAIG